MILTLKRTPGIYLVGFMGSGKSTVGRKLAERIGWPFHDLDSIIEGAQGRTIAAIFEQDGEPAFREVERGALWEQVRRIERGEPRVLALGGGAFAQEENVRMLADRGVTLWIDCPFARIQERVGRATHRPLARDPERFAQLFAERRAAYARADFRIPFDSDDPEEAIQAILALKLL